MKDKRKKLFFKVPINSTDEEEIQFAEMVYQKIQELVKETEEEEMLDRQDRIDIRRGIGMNKYQIRITCIAKGVYQAFIQNIDSDAEFVRIAVGEEVKIGKLKLNYLREHSIISPLKRGGEHVHIGNFMPEYDGIASRVWFAFDAVKRGKPNKVIEKYFGSMPPKSKLRSTIGADMYVELQARENGDPLNKFIEKKTSNSKPERKYAAPNRAGYTPAGTKGEDGVIDIGWNEGVTSDGRPYRAEMWAVDQVSTLTIFISNLDIEEATEEELIAYLEREGLISYLGSRKSLYPVLIHDNDNNPVWSINITIGDDEESFADSGFAIKPYN